MPELVGVSLMPLEVALSAFVVVLAVAVFLVLEPGDFAFALRWVEALELQLQKLNRYLLLKDY